MVKPQRPLAQLAGFTLIEMLAVLVIISSTSWLLIRSFDPSSHSAFQFSKVFNQYVMHAQARAFASQGLVTPVRLSLAAEQGAPSLTLEHSGRFLSGYKHDTQLDVDVAVGSKASSDYVFEFDGAGLLLNSQGEDSAPLSMVIDGSARYCLLVNGLLRPINEGC